MTTDYCQKTKSYEWIVIRYGGKIICALRIFLNDWRAFNDY